MAAPANWADLAVLLLVGLLIDLGLLSTAWPFGTPVSVWPAGLGGFPKMMMANLALYGYLVIKPIDGIGYDLAPRFSDLKTGLREFLFYAPFVLSLGFLLGFLHWHGAKAHPLEFPGAWIFTLFFVALPEELFFRGLVQNLLERRMGRTPLSLPLQFCSASPTSTNAPSSSTGDMFFWRPLPVSSMVGRGVNVNGCLLLP